MQNDLKGTMTMNSYEHVPRLSRVTAYAAAGLAVAVGASAAFLAFGFVLVFSASDTPPMTWREWVVVAFSLCAAILLVPGAVLLL